MRSDEISGADERGADVARHPGGPQSRTSTSTQWPVATVFPGLASYGLIGDCHSAALISREGSIDWCCLPRFDSDSCFGRLLDWEQGGYFSLVPTHPCEVTRGYLGDSLVLATHYSSAHGEARVLDFFAMRTGGRYRPRRELVRVIEGVKGRMSFDAVVIPRFDFGEVKPWIFERKDGSFAVVGSNKGLVVLDDVGLALQGEHALSSRFEVSATERRHIAVQFTAPETADSVRVEAYTTDLLDTHLQETLRWWSDWVERIGPESRKDPTLVRSAIILKALTYAPTGAMVAAVTTSLPENIGGERNWDYRFSWLRDSIFAVESLGEMGCASEADGFRRFVQRSTAGNADELQVMYGVDGKRRLTEVTLDRLSGWRGSKPVRIGNAAYEQFQMDMYGLMLDLSWRWHLRGNKLSQHYWDLLVEILQITMDRWMEPDRGIWEIRSDPRHFVHSKVMCWVAFDRGLQLAKRLHLQAPREQWRQCAAKIRQAVFDHGTDPVRGNFVESFGSRQLDAALLLLPEVGFVAYDEPRMMLTAELIGSELECDGLILRYKTEDGLRGSEGVFLPCTFWLAEVYARQGRAESARRFFERAAGCANDLGLFAEEYDTRLDEAIGNFPQALTHLAHISAGLALLGHDGVMRRAVMH